MTVLVREVQPQPRVDLLSTDAASGAPVRVTTYRGVVALELEMLPGIHVGSIGLPQANAISFFLPDSLPYRNAADAAISLTVTPGLQPVLDRVNVGTGPYGVHSGTATLQEYPEGSGTSWVHLAFVNTYATRTAEACYCITVVTPSGAPESTGS
ncbi:MAG: hypothetical protein WCI74_02655 [Actinomycetes bacterium]